MSAGLGADETVASNGAITLDFLDRAQRLAIRRAARDAHRTVCDRAIDECLTCMEHARSILEAKRELGCRQVPPKAR